MFVTNMRHHYNMKKRKETTKESTRIQTSTGSCNLLQEAKAVSDLIDVVVSILPWVNVDTLLPALKHTHTTPIRKYCMQNKSLKLH